jgi:hypothetical protein
VFQDFLLTCLYVVMIKKLLNIVRYFLYFSLVFFLEIVRLTCATVVV